MTDPNADIKAWRTRTTERVQAWREKMPSALTLFTVILCAFAVGLTLNVAINAPPIAHPPAPVIKHVFVPIRIPILVPAQPVEPLPPASDAEHPTIINAATETPAPTAQGPAIYPAAPAPPAPATAVEEAKLVDLPVVKHSEATARRLRCLTPAMRVVFDDLEQKFGELEVVATCDHSYYVQGTHHVSHHVGGNAVDFLPGAKRGEILAYLAAHHKAGLTMTYSSSPHIHIDIGHHGVILARRDRGLALPDLARPAPRARVASVRRRHTWRHRYSDDDDSW